MDEQNETKQNEVKGPADHLADIVDLLASDNSELTNMAKHFELMRESQQRILGEMSAMNIRLKTIAIHVSEYPETVISIDESAGGVKPEPEPVILPVHGIRISDQMAMCGAQGTVAQPYWARKNERVSAILSEITCPECLKIIAENLAVEEKS